MKPCRVLLILVMTSSAWARNAPSRQQSSGETQAGSAQTPATERPEGQRAQHRERMQAMCKEHIEGMKADVQKIHSAFDRMKGNVATISNADEKARWQANLDMWQTVMDHHDRMLKHMEDAQAKGMGCGMMMGEMGMGSSMMHHHGTDPTNANSTAPVQTHPQ